VPSGPTLLREPRRSSPRPTPGGRRPQPGPPPVALAADANEPSLAGAMAVAVVTLVVLFLIGGLVAVVITAAVSHPSGADQVVFTESAPYSPAADQATVPAAKVSVPAPAANAPAPRGNWTAARGDQIAYRALQWLGWPYSFDAGNANGPSFGHAVDADSRNDGNVYGFDCSGLVMYALGPWRGLDHSAAAQYTETGSFHPMLADLQPGDLVFWSKDGTVNGIGHVAVYVGSGEVVEAPQSGDVIKVMPLNEVEPGKLGLTRPLT
jgi:peptidoglycan DL-endopeptidase RipA